MNEQRFAAGYCFPINGALQELHVHVLIVTPPSTASISMPISTETSAARFAAQRA